MPPILPHCPHLLLLLLLACQVSTAASAPRPTSLPAPHADASLSPLSVHLYPQPQAPSAQVMDFLFEKWKLYGDQCLHNLSLLPPPTGEPRLRPESCPPNPTHHLQVRKLGHREAGD